MVDIDIKICGLLAKPRCSHCRGKGYIYGQTGRTIENKDGQRVSGPIIGKGENAVVSEYVKYCSCVESKLNKNPS